MRRGTRPLPGKKESPSLLIRAFHSRPYTSTQSSQFSAVHRANETLPTEQSAHHRTTTVSPDDREPATDSLLQSKSSSSLINLSDVISDNPKPRAANSRYGSYLRWMQARHQHYVKKKLKHGNSLLSRKPHPVGDQSATQMIFVSSNKKPKRSVSKSLAVIRKKLMTPTLRCEEPKSTTKDYAFTSLLRGEQLLKTEGSQVHLKPRQRNLFRHFL